MQAWEKDLPDRLTPDAVVAHWLAKHADQLVDFGVLNADKVSMLRQLLDASMFACVAPVYYEREK